MFKLIVYSNEHRLQAGQFDELKFARLAGLGLISIAEKDKLFINYRYEIEDSKGKVVARYKDGQWLNN